LDLELCPRQSEAATATLPSQGVLWELKRFCWPELDVVKQMEQRLQDEMQLDEGDEEQILSKLHISSNTRTAYDGLLVLVANRGGRRVQEGGRCIQQGREAHLVGRRGRRGGHQQKPSGEAWHVGAAIRRRTAGEGGVDDAAGGGGHPVKARTAQPSEGAPDGAEGGVELNVVARRSLLVGAGSI
jgi:hypothetical protein